MSPVRRGFVILLSAAAVVALGLLLAQDRRTLRPRSAVTAEDTRFPEYVAALVGTDVARGNRYEVFTNGDQFFPAMLTAINQARTRVSFETYIYDTGSVADQFTTALEQAARRGVRVQLTIDAVGASKMEQAHIDRLKVAGCSVVQFNTPHWYSLEEVNYRTHRKILVTDGEIAFTGGAGVADHWLGHAQDPEHWRDTQVRATGPSHACSKGLLRERHRGRAPGGAQLDDPRPPADDYGPTILVRSSPSGGSSDLKRLYLLLIASATRTLGHHYSVLVTDESPPGRLTMR